MASAVYTTRATTELHHQIFNETLISHGMDIHSPYLAAPNFFPLISFKGTSLRKQTLNNPGIEEEYLTRN